MGYKATHVRKSFVFDTNVVNEQATIMQAMKKIREGSEPEVEIHKHRATEECPYPDNKLRVKHTRDLSYTNGKQCYILDGETDG